MPFDVLDPRDHLLIPVCDGSGTLRDGAAIAHDVSVLPEGTSFRLVAPKPLDAGEASVVFRALEGQRRPFSVRLRLAAVEHKPIAEDAARAGCIAVEVEREGSLVEALASGLHDTRRALERVTVALRRLRGLGIATVVHLPLGLPEDDEGVFERALRFVRRAMVAVPVIRSAGDRASAVAQAEHGERRMDPDSIENGIHWLRRRLARHTAIWRRAFWPGGTRSIALSAGYRLRAEAARAREGRYTARMALLRALNRTMRARARAPYLHTLPGRATAHRLTRRAWLRTKAASDARMRALFIQVEGALDLRGARALLDRVSQAVQAGYQRITIDVVGVEAVSREVVTGFLAENKARLAEVAQWTRVVNLVGLLEALRQQLEDSEDLRLIESAARA
jgi:hypothetical protein